MNLSFNNAKSKSTRVKKLPAAPFADSDEPEASTKTYVVEFLSGEGPPPDSTIKSIAPIPNVWRPNKKLKNLHNLPQISQSDGADSAVKFEVDPVCKPEPTDGSVVYGLNLRQPSATTSGVPVPARDRGETIADLELRKLKEDLEKLPEDSGMDDYTDVPVDEFAAALLSGYGWKEGAGIGRNRKEDVKVPEVKKKIGRGGLGFIEEIPEKQIDTNGNAASENPVNGNEKTEKLRIVNGRKIGMKGKIVNVKSGGDLLVLRLSRSNEKVEVPSRDVAELGSEDEEKCLRKLKELEIKDNKDRNLSRKRDEQEEKPRKEKISWLRNHIRVRIISKKLKGGRLYLKKGVVVDVVGPGMCDISVDESRELVQGVDQELLETALPKRGGPVLVLYGRYKGVYGSLVERDSEKETCVLRDEDTHELLNVRLEQIAEYTGDPSDIGY
ncbi:hypothetical protein MIMGU_mgv1a006523mg [Erythranthe guttata]|uniref:G-patch domain-containing protein n=1 Tax=Erythranthe guttata TaxID=4155 RepID=A0A022RF14_ERYGU|nr:hypothetical protein MIMGU_mgv1a006523mg [Erythranthe guttata]